MKKITIFFTCFFAAGALFAQSEYAYSPIPTAFNNVASFKTMGNTTVMGSVIFSNLRFSGPTILSSVNSEIRLWSWTATGDVIIKSDFGSAGESKLLNLGSSVEIAIEENSSVNAVTMTFLDQLGSTTVKGANDIITHKFLIAQGEDQIAHIRFLEAYGLSWRVPTGLTFASSNWQWITITDDSGKQHIVFAYN